MFSVLLWCDNDFRLFKDFSFVSVAFVQQRIHNTHDHDVVLVNQIDLITVFLVVNGACEYLWSRIMETSASAWAQKL